MHRKLLILSRMKWTQSMSLSGQPTSNGDGILCSNGVHPSEALQNASLTYLSSHFHDGTVSVFAPTGPPQEFIIQIVANKYNPTNYWYESSSLFRKFH